MKKNWSVDPMNNDDLDTSQTAEDAYTLKTLEESIKVIDGK